MDWEFRAFGISTSPEKNSMEKTPEGIKLRAALFDEKGQVREKGGKLMAFFDGISYYYTTIPADSAYVYCEAEIHVDKLNPTLDGQEGFALLLRDCLGRDGDGENCYMANSCAVLATALPDKSGEKVRDCLGWRFVWDLRKEDAASAVKGEGKSFSEAFEPALYIREGETYRLALKKDEAGFHVGLPDRPGAAAHFPEPSRMLRLNDKEWYIGVAAARGVEITIRDLSLEIGDEKQAARRERFKMPQKKPELSLLRRTAAAGEAFELPFYTETAGRLSLRTEDGRIYSGDTEASSVKTFTLPAAEEGEQQIRWQFTDEDGGEIEGKERLSCRRLQTEKGSLFIAPQGRPEAAGSREDPYDLPTVLAYARPGLSAELLPGRYVFKEALEIPYGVSGRPDAPVRLFCREGEALIDFASEGGPFLVNGDYWRLENIRFSRSRADRSAIKVGGSYNHFKHIVCSGNGNTGFQITGPEQWKRAYWPKENKVFFSVSSDNADPGQNNADGFAAKLACGEGNAFTGCIAYNNIDDGWDLYSRIENGPIGAAEISYCLGSRNGRNLAKTLQADGNGFKLGGEGIPIPHRLRHSLAVENDVDGITSNSNPALILENSVSAASGGRNFAVYGQGEEASAAKASECLSAEGTLPDLLPAPWGEEEVRESSKSAKRLLAEWRRAFVEKFPEEKAWLDQSLARMQAEQEASESKKI